MECASAKTRLAVSLCAISNSERRELRGPGVAMDATTKLTPLSDALAGDLSSDQLAALEDALPTLLPLLDDAEALKSRLKALGVAKLGHRLKVFGVLQRYEPPPPPSESSGFWERIAAGSTEATRPSTKWQRTAA